MCVELVAALGLAAAQHTTPLRRDPRSGEQGTAIRLLGQDARRALSLCDRDYVLTRERDAISNTGLDLWPQMDQVEEHYLSPMLTADTDSHEVGTMTVAQIARLVAKPGRRDELIEALQPCFDAIEEERGNLLYVMLTDKRSIVTQLDATGRAERTELAQPDEVWFVEMYLDDDALEAHDARYDQVPVLRDVVMPRVGELLAEPYELIRARTVRSRGVQ